MDFRNFIVPSKSVFMLISFLFTEIHIDLSFQRKKPPRDTHLSPAFRILIMQTEEPWGIFSSLMRGYNFWGYFLWRVFSRGIIWQGAIRRKNSASSELETLNILEENNLREEKL